jgi:hypothetical protein
MFPIPTILMVAMSGLALLSVVIVVSTGSFTSLLVVLLLIGLLGFVLFKMGVFKITQTKGEIDFGFYESAPAPAPSVPITPHSLEQNEVFFVSGNDYTYDDAPAVCAAYGADLATYDQVNTAYEAGGEWCGYGWTQGGMALFPTQESTWNVLQQESDQTKRTSCGRPGVNGGYFNPSNKFGVNCYGIKPGNKNHIKFPLPIAGTDEKQVDKYKNMLSKMTVSAFNRLGWSEWNAKSHTPGMIQTLEKDISAEFSGPSYAKIVKKKDK